VTDGSSAPFLSYGRQSISDEDIEAVVAVLRGDWLTQGPTVDAFESELASLTGARHAIACSNGTTGLHIAAAALDLQPRDAVIVPSITFLATANAIRYVGAEVVFADVNPDTALMEPQHLEDALARAKALGLRPRAVFPVHLAGHPADVRDAARAAGLMVVEDACHALGTRMRRGDGEVTVGSGSGVDMTVFSFHPVKTIATGEGGAVTTSDDELGDRLRRFRSHGMVREPQLFRNREEAFSADGKPNPWYYEMPDIGFNYRLTDLQSALGLSQLKRIDRFIERREEIVDLYDRSLAPLSPYIKPLSRSKASGSRVGWHLYVGLFDFEGLGLGRAEVMAALREKNIGSQVHYVPVHWQPYYTERYGKLDLPGAATYYRRCLSLPLYPGLQDADVQRVVDALAGLVKRAA
jgi:UDP-4-amino-4,6-dideoxy-N-acetyl-beta-L-altrosamine transaminase